MPRKVVRKSPREARIVSMLAAASPRYVKKCVASSAKGGIATGTQQDLIVAQSPARITHIVAVADHCGMEAVENELNIDSVEEDALKILHDLDSTGKADKEKKRDTVAEQKFGNEADYCTVQSDLSNFPLPVHSILGGEVQDDGIAPLNDFSDCCMQDSSDDDFVLFLSDLLDGGGDAFEVDDFLLADFEPVQEESGCGLAEIQPSLLSQPTGGTTPSPQMQEPANVVSQTQVLLRFLECSLENRDLPSYGSWPTKIQDPWVLALFSLYGIFPPLNDFMASQN